MLMMMMIVTNKYYIIFTFRLSFVLGKTPMVVAEASEKTLPRFVYIIMWCGMK